MRNITHEFEDAVFITNLPEPKKGNDREATGLILKVRRNAQATGKVTAKPYTPTPKSKVYFYPGCNVPRFKVREWGKKHGITVTIKQANATATFASDKSIDSLIQTEWRATVKRQHLLSYLSTNYVLTEGTRLKEIYDLIVNNQSEYVYLPYWYTHSRPWFYESSRHNRAPAGIQPLNDFGSVTSGVYSYTTQESFQKIASIVSDPLLYPEAEIIELINEDAAVLDKQMYTQLSAMLKSDDKKNVVLAMETMANCNLNSSLHFVLLLLQEHGNVIYQQKEKNHVNFKSLMKYVGTNGYGISNDQIIQVLMEKGVLTMEILSETAAIVKSHLQNQFDTQHFKIKSITVSDAVQSYFTGATEIQSEQIVEQETNVE
jgi:hypothetical protein